MMMEKPISVERRAVRLAALKNQRWSLRREIGHTNYNYLHAIKSDLENGGTGDSQLIQHIDEHYHRCEAKLKDVEVEIQAITRCRALRGILPARGIDAIQLQTPGVNRDTKAVCAYLPDAPIWVVAKEQPIQALGPDEFLEFPTFVEVETEDMQVMKLNGLGGDAAFFKYGYSVLNDKIYYNFHEVSFR